MLKDFDLSSRSLTEEIQLFQSNNDYFLVLFSKKITFLLKKDNPSRKFIIAEKEPVWLNG